MFESCFFARYLGPQQTHTGVLYKYEPGWLLSSSLAFYPPPFHLSATLYNMQQSDNDTLLACSRPQRENHLSNYQQSRVSARHLWCSGPISPSFPQAATRQALDTLSTATGKITCQTTQPAITSATYSPRRRPRPSKMTLTPRRTRTALCSAAVPSG